MWRLGLCCQFREEPIHWRTLTAQHLSRLPRAGQLARLAAVCRANATALQAALAYCVRQKIGAFRVSSRLLPLATHPAVGYAVTDLPGAAALVAAFRAAGRYARAHGLRLSFHPDQFIVLNSPDAAIVRRSVADLVYHAQLAEWLGADVINIHAGGAYGDKPAALRRFRTAVGRLPAAVRRRLTLENDDRLYTPTDLWPVCRDLGLPLVYDVHHHRCRPDGLTVAAATAVAWRTWDREPLFHLASPAAGWHRQSPAPHHDFISPADIPAVWLPLRLTVEVEAKAKELAVARLRRWLARRAP